jgi:hypothetical protein
MLMKGPARRREDVFCWVPAPTLFMSGVIAGPHVERRVPGSFAGTRLLVLLLAATRDNGMLFVGLTPEGGVDLRFSPRPPAIQAGLMSGAAPFFRESGGAAFFIWPVAGDAQRW